MFESFYSNFFSAGALIPALFFIFISLLYISIPDKSRATIHIGIAYICLAVFNFGYFIAASFYHPLAAYHRWVTVSSILLAETHLNMFMYYLFEERNERFGRFLLIFQYVIVIATTLAFFYVSHTSGVIFKAGAHHYDFNADAFSTVVGYIIQFFLFMFIILLVWKTVTVKDRRKWGVLLIGLIYIVGTVSNSLMNVLSFAGYVERETFRIVWDISNLFFFFLITVVYFNYTRDKTTFMSKIIAVSFVTILTVLQIINYITYEVVDRAYDTVHKLATQYTYGTEYRSEDTDYIIRYNINERTYRKVFFREDHLDLQYFRYRESDFRNADIWLRIASLRPDNFRREMYSVIDTAGRFFSGYRNAIRKYFSSRPVNKQSFSDFTEALKRKLMYPRSKIQNIPDDNFRGELTGYLHEQGSGFGSFSRPILQYLADTDKSGDDLKQEVLGFLRPFHSPDTRQYRAIKGNHYISYMAARPGSGNVYEVGFSYAYYRSFMHKSVRRYIIITVVLLTLLFAGFRFLFFRELISSMKRLVEGVKKVRDGNYDVKVDVYVEDEIGFLTHHFNEMVGTIKNNTADLTRELSEKLKAEETLRESEKKYRTLFNSANDAIFIHDYNTFKIVDVNERVCEMYGFSRDEALKLTIDDLSYGKNPYTSIDGQRYLENARSGKPQQFEWLARRKDQSLFWIEVNMYRTSIMGEDRILVFVRDISQRKKAEEQLQQAQKIETLGTLAGGIAHDFNNILAGLTGSLSLLDHELKGFEDSTREKLSEYVSIMKDSSIRAADMVKQLLALSRNEDISYAPVDLNLSVKHVVKICDSSFDKSIEVQPVYCPEPAMISADPTRIEQALLNLCVNASHAMTIMREVDEMPGGTLTISIERVEPDSHFRVSFPAAEELPYWKLSVRDNGIGMDVDTLGKIFDPFFTTKTKGAGTGLGLSMVFNIVKSHQGFIDVYSEVGIGSVFNVYFPVMRKRDSGRYSLEDKKDIYYGSGLVLVVEDEKLIRKMTRSMLNECGYEVIVAEDGSTGIDIFSKRHGQIRAVILDMVMPKLSGKDVFYEMKQIDPDARIILTSGYSSDERVNELKDAGIVGFIQKPYTLKDLSEIVARATGEE